MKKSIYLTASLLALNLTPVFGQPNQPNYTTTPAPAPQSSFDQRLQAIVNAANPQQKPTPELTKFNLDFPGGTPKELVAAIEKAMGKPLNAIIPTEDAAVQMPPLKMNDVVVPQLFAALEAASRKTVAVQSGNFGVGYSTFTTDYGFNTADSPVTDASIWYFHAEKPSSPPVVSTEKVSEFYPLSTYLDRGFTVDDITTAIQTGWKMEGETSPPELSFHKETKLLIAVGEPVKLQTIEKVLQRLPQSNATRNEIDNLKSDVSRLQKQVDQLTKKISPPPPTTLELKSGQ